MALSSSHPCKSLIVIYPQNSLVDNKVTINMIPIERTRASRRYRTIFNLLNRASNQALIGCLGSEIISVIVIEEQILDSSFPNTLPQTDYSPG